jgi:hypothetical protein
MKNLLLYFLAFVAVWLGGASCQQRSTATEEVKDTAVQQQQPAGDTTPAVNSAPAINTDSLPAETVGQMILDGKLVPGDNVFTYRMMDSLLSATSPRHPFYFRVFDKIMDHADGALGEAIGDYSLTYVEQQPSAFIKNIQPLPKHRFETWASQVGIELFLSSNEPGDSYKKFESATIANCKTCNATALQSVRRFNQLVWQTMQANIKAESRREE